MSTFAHGANHVWECVSSVTCHKRIEHPQDNFSLPNERGGRGEFCVALRKNYRLEVVRLFLERDNVDFVR